MKILIKNEYYIILLYFKNDVNRNQCNICSVKFTNICNLWPPKVFAC